METAKLNLKIASSIWWSYFWRAGLVSFLLAVPLGVIGGLIIGNVGQTELVGVGTVTLGCLGSIPISIWALKSALSKQHGGCSLILVRQK